LVTAAAVLFNYHEKEKKIFPDELFKQHTSLEKPINSPPLHSKSKREEKFLKSYPLKNSS